MSNQPELSMSRSMSGAMPGELSKPADSLQLDLNQNSNNKSGRVFPLAELGTLLPEAKLRNPQITFIDLVDALGLAPNDAIAKSKSVPSIHTWMAKDDFQKLVDAVFAKPAVELAKGEYEQKGSSISATMDARSLETLGAKGVQSLLSSGHIEDDATRSARVSGALSPDADQQNVANLANHINETALRIESQAALKIKKPIETGEDQTLQAQKIFDSKMPLNQVVVDEQMSKSSTKQLPDEQEGVAPLKSNKTISKQASVAQSNGNDLTNTKRQGSSDSLRTTKAEFIAGQDHAVSASIGANIFANKNKQTVVVHQPNKTSVKNTPDKLSPSLTVYSSEG